MPTPASRSMVSVASAIMGSKDLSAAPVRSTSRVSAPRPAKIPLSSTAM